MDRRRVRNGTHVLALGAHHALGQVEPRAVLKEFGLDIPPSVEIKTWDSSAQIRWFVVPERPAGTDGVSEAELAKLITAEGMMGVARV